MHFSGRPSVIGADRFSQGSELAQVVEGESESTKNMVKKTRISLGNVWKSLGKFMETFLIFTAMLQDFATSISYQLDNLTFEE